MIKKIGLLFLVICFVSGCASQKSMYKKAMELNTIEAYKQFLSKNPEGEFTNAVKTKLVELEFEKAKNSNNIWGYESFLSNYPNSKYENDVREELAFLKSKDSNSTKEFEEFLKVYPESKHTSDVLENLAFLKAIETGTIEAYEKFLHDFPNSPKTLKVSVKITLLKDAYVVNNNNWKNLSEVLKEENRTIFNFEDKLLDKKPLPEDLSKMASLWIRQVIFTRPPDHYNYQLLNAYGCMIKKAVSYSNSGSFERAFSGSYFPRFIFSLRFSSTDDKTKGANIYCIEDEYNTSDPNIIKYKEAVLDMLADNVNSKARDPIIEFLSEIKQKEKNKKLLSRINQILSN